MHFPDDAPRYRAGDICVATGAPASAVAEWLRHGLVPLAPADLAPSGRGRPGAFTFRTVVAFAVALRLANVGMARAAAGALAARLVDGWDAQDISPGVTVSVDLPEIRNQVSRALGADIASART